MSIFSKKRKPTREEMLVSKAVYTILVIVSLWFPIFKIQSINLSFFDILKLATSIGAGSDIVILLICAGDVVLTGIIMFICEIFKFKQKKYTLSLATGNCVALLGLLYVYIKVAVQKTAGVGYGADLMVAFALANIICLFYEYKQLKNAEMSEKIKTDTKDDNNNLEISQK